MNKDNLIGINIGLYPDTLYIIDEIRGLIPRRTYIRNILELHAMEAESIIEDEAWENAHNKHQEEFLKEHGRLDDSGTFEMSSYKKCEEESQDIKEFGL